MVGEGYMRVMKMKKRKSKKCSADDVVAGGVFAAIYLPLAVAFKLADEPKYGGRGVCKRGRKKRR